MEINILNRIVLDAAPAPEAGALPGCATLRDLGVAGFLGLSGLGTQAQNWKSREQTEYRRQVVPKIDRSDLACSPEVSERVHASVCSPEIFDQHPSGDRSVPSALLRICASPNAFVSGYRDARTDTSRNWCACPAAGQRSSPERTVRLPRAGPYEAGCGPLVLARTSCPARSRDGRVAAGQISARSPQDYAERRRRAAREQ
jgi:hypothetical protein